MTNAPDFSSWQSEEDYQYAVTATITRVFLWMFVGLILTAITALMVVKVPALNGFLFSSTAPFFVLIVLELGLVLLLRATVNTMSSTAATVVFLLYAAVNGATLSVIFFTYDISTIGNAFGVTAVTFGVMAAFGLMTRRDLTGIGSLCFMGLIGVIVASVTNLFLRNDLIDTVISVIAVLVFVGLTAYDTQKIKRRLESAPGYMMVDDPDEVARKISIYGALELYLDFINLFLHILSIMGKKRR